MTLGSPVTDRNRATAALVFLVVGILLLVWAWGSWVYRTSVSATSPVVAEATGRHERPGPVEEDATSRRSLIAGAVLVPVVLFGGYVLVRSFRRSTKTVDASSAHRLREYDSGVESHNNDT